MDCIFFRQDPPPDERFLASTFALEELESRVVFVNAPSAVRNHIEKIALLRIGEADHNTLLSMCVDAIHDFVMEMGAAVIKPAFGFQGQGVWVVSASQPYLRALLESLPRGQPVLVGPFDEAVLSGVTRVIAFRDRILGAMKFLPKEDDFRALSGGTEQREELSGSARDRVLSASAKLAEAGVSLVGYDLIGDRIIDSNIMSPGCLQRIERASGVKVADAILDETARLVQLHSGESRCI